MLNSIPSTAFRDFHDRLTYKRRAPPSVTHPDYYAIMLPPSSIFFQHCCPPPILGCCSPALFQPSPSFANSFQGAARLFNSLKLFSLFLFQISAQVFQQVSLLIFGFFSHLESMLFLLIQFSLISVTFFVTNQSKKEYKP